VSVNTGEIQGNKRDRLLIFIVFFDKTFRLKNEKKKLQMPERPRLAPSTQTGVDSTVEQPLDV